MRKLHAIFDFLAVSRSNLTSRSAWTQIPNTDRCITITKYFEINFSQLLYLKEKLEESIRKKILYINAKESNKETSEDFVKENFFSMEVFELRRSRITHIQKKGRLTTLAKKFSVFADLKLVIFKLSP